MQIYLALCDSYRVEIAENTETVMYMLRKLRPEVLLLDFKAEQFTRNGKSSMDFVRKVKRKYEDLKVVLILDPRDCAREDELHGCGVDWVLYTPVKPRNLLANLDRMTTETALA